MQNELRPTLPEYEVKMLKAQLLARALESQNQSQLAEQLRSRLGLLKVPRASTTKP